MKAQRHASAGKISVDEIQSVVQQGDSFNTLEKLHQFAARLNTDLDSGISNAEVIERKLLYGANAFSEPPSVNIFLLFISAWKDPTMIILTAAAAISLTLGLLVPFLTEEEHENGWIDGTAILAAVIVVAVVNSVNDWNKDRQFRSLNKKKAETMVKVIREGNQVVVGTSDLVVGDVCRLEAGDLVPADGVLIKSFDLYADESATTGESVPRLKDRDEPMLYCGSVITDGVGQILVTSVGMRTQWGEAIAAVDLAVDDSETPLQEQLGKLATLIGKIGLGVAIAAFLALVGWWLKDIIGQEWQWDSLIPVLKHFIVAVTIVVVAVPEGLPLAVTVSLAYSMRKMMKDNNLVRYLVACETMGGANTICSDKTGTLTQNRMTVVEGWLAGADFANQFVSQAEYSRAAIASVIECVSVNSTADIEPDGNLSFKYIGNKTECSLLVFVTRLQGNYRRVRKENKIIGLIPFNSHRKRMSTAIIPSDGKSSVRLCTKGNPEAVLALCTRYMNARGDELPLDEAHRNQLFSMTNAMASKGLRTLCLAYRDFDSNVEKWTEEHEADLTLIGVVGIEDPLRPEVPAAILDCKRAGIKVRMVTGDSLNTASKIAEECGILTSEGVAMTAADFRSLSDEEALTVLPKLQVLARSTPMDKFNLVKRLKEQGDVVAVTGDGTNDAPALKAADVGLSMGIEGTDVAKRASDIVILDDNFASIVSAVMWGRNVKQSIRKFLQFQLTVNIVGLIIALASAVANFGTPLRAIQLLWINMIMDSMAALALGTEKPTRELLRNKPEGRETNLITRIMIRNMVAYAFIELVMLIGFLLFAPRFLDITPGKDIQGPSIHYTMLFNTFVFCQIFNEINSRKVGNEINVFGGFFTNWIFVSIIVFTIGVQFVLIQFAGEFFYTVPLGLVEWGICVAGGIIMIPLGFIVRLIPVQKRQAEVLLDTKVKGKKNEKSPLIDV